MKADEDKMKEHGKKLASKIINNWRKSVRERGASLRERAEPSAQPNEENKDTDYIGFDEALSGGDIDIVPAHDSGIYRCKGVPSLNRFRRGYTGSFPPKI